MAGDIQRGSHATAAQRRAAAVAFGGGSRATVARDYNRSGRTYLSRGESVRYFEASAGESSDFVYVYRAARLRR
jgi:hypothetical protein